jgi:pentatricopeptide repeat protein
MSLRTGLARVGRHVRSHPPPAHTLLLAHNAHARSLWGMGGNKPAVPAKDRTQKPGRVNAAAAQTPRIHVVEEQKMLIHHFTNALGMNDVAALHRWYNAIRRVLLNNPQEQPWLNRAQLTGALSLLAVTHRNFSLNFPLIDTILGDMPILHGITVDEDMHERILDGLVRTGMGFSLEVPYKYVFTLPERPGDLPPSVRLWNTLLTHFKAREDTILMRRCLRDMIDTGCTPTLQSYALYFEAINSTLQLPTMEEVTTMAREMVSLELPYDQTTWEILCDAFIKDGYRALADDIRDMYDEKYGNSLGGVSAQQTGMDRLHRELTSIAAKEGVSVAVQHFRNQRRSLKPTFDTLAAILRSSSKLTDMRNAERGLDLRAGTNARIWMLLIKNADIKGFAHNAVEVYEQAKRAGVTCSANLATPVIHVLCRKNGNTHEDALDVALDIYRDLCEAEAKGDRPDAKGPSLPIYRALTRALVLAPNQDKFYPRVMELFGDMKTRKLPVDSRILGTVILASMRMAHTPEKAYLAYERITEGSPPLDILGYHHILVELCRVRHGLRVLPSLDVIFDVTADARAAGLDVTEVAYSNWITAAGRLATAVSGEMANDVDAAEAWESIRNAIRRVHDRLAIDATVTPSPVLWTTLMDAYQRARMPAEAMRVWDMMVSQGKLSEAAISVMVDTCSHARWYPLMQDIWGKLRRAGIPLNDRNWKNYIEALCRCGKLAEAMQTTCEVLPQLNEPTLPNVDCIRTIMYFARGWGREDEVKRQFKQQIPDVWTQYVKNPI